MHMVCHMPSLRHFKTKFSAELDFHGCLNLKIKIVSLSLRIDVIKMNDQVLNLN